MTPHTQWVHVSRAHIRDAIPGDLVADPMAAAVRHRHGDGVTVDVYPEEMWLRGGTASLVASLPFRAQKFAEDFAAGRHVRPLWFRVRWQKP